MTLRPEMTPTLARMIAARGGALAKPLKWFSIAQCFRYERMSRGRKREHYQWNLDIVGVNDVTAEAELLAVAIDVLKQLGLTADDVVVRISPRGLVSAVLEGLSVPQDKWTAVFGIIDKRGKEDDIALKKQLTALELPDKTLTRLFDLLDQNAFEPFQQVLSESDLDTKPIEELMMLFDYLDAYGLQHYCEFSPSIVRGLPYYTGIVFECFDRAGNFRAVFGGGRYDNLLELLSDGSEPAVGLGFGDVVIQEILAEKKELPEICRSMDCFIIPYSINERPLAMRVAQQLRSQGLRADMLLNPKKLKGAMREAVRVKAKFVLLLLPDELEQGLFVLRSLNTGSEERIPQDRFLADPVALLGRE